MNVVEERSAQVTNSLLTIVLGCDFSNAWQFMLLQKLKRNATSCIHIFYFKGINSALKSIDESITIVLISEGTHPTGIVVLVVC